jgi:hypothetical protein
MLITKRWRTSRQTRRRPLARPPSSHGRARQASRRRRSPHAQARADIALSGRDPAPSPHRRGKRRKPGRVRISSGPGTGMSRSSATNRLPRSRTTIARIFAIIGSPLVAMRQSSPLGQASLRIIRRPAPPRNEHSVRSRSALDHGTKLLCRGPVKRYRFPLSS